MIFFNIQAFDCLALFKYLFYESREFFTHIPPASFNHGAEQADLGNNSRNTSLFLHVRKFFTFFSFSESIIGAQVYLIFRRTPLKTKILIGFLQISWVTKKIALNRYQFQSRDFTIITWLFLERNRATLVVNVRWKLLSSSMTCLAIDLWQHELSVS